MHPKPKPKPNTLDHVIGDALKANQFVSLQDTDHTSSAVQDGLKDMIPSLAKHGVKHLFLEIGKPSFFASNDGHQDRMDEFFEGKISEKEVYAYFKKYPTSMWNTSQDAAKQTTDLIKLCKAHGIRVWASDPGLSLMTSAKMLTKIPTFMRIEKVASTYVSDPCKRAPVNFSKVTDLELDINDAVMILSKDRHGSMNKDVAEFMVSKAKDQKGTPEKAAFFWGTGHSNNYIGATNLDEYVALLDSAKTQKITNIAIYPSKLAWQCSQGTVGNDTDYLYFTLDKEVTLNKQYSEKPIYKNFEAKQKESDSFKQRVLKARTGSAPH